MITPTVFHEDTFYEYFKPRSHLSVERDIWGGVGLETYGRDIETVRTHDPNYVWTVVDGDSGRDQWIVAGFHFVNRVCYIISAVPHNGIDVEFRVEQKPRSLTSLGLRRQVNRLGRLASHQSNL